ncbi:MAG: alpha/beta hydrolase [Thermoplasmatota archaeon]
MNGAAKGSINGIPIRTYGKKPYRIAVIHGGPGAPGEMRPVAKVLSRSYGVLEPIQTADSIDGQVEELRNLLETYTTLPITLIGYSWGAFLSYLFAAQNPASVKKLILVSSGPFKDSFVTMMNKRRTSRLTKREQLHIAKLFELLRTGTYEEKMKNFEELAHIFTTIEAYRPLPSNNEVITYQPDIFLHVMNEVDNLRSTGKLLSFGKRICCPVVAIHGDYDSHPAQGVNIPLSEVIEDFRFILLPFCDHTPWNEHHAKDEFYEILWAELKE